MKAIHIENPGPESRLLLSDVSTPEPKSNEVLIRVEATAMNRADLLQMAGRYPVPEGVTEIPGLEAAGVVESVGSEVEGIKIGDRVCTLLDGGGYAEYVTVDQHMVMPIPDGMSMESAAAIPEVFLTAWQALYWLAVLKHREAVLIHAGASGVGTAAIQLARTFSDARVAVTAGSDEKLELCRSLGAELPINYKKNDFSEAISRQWGRAQVDVVIDFIGAPYWNQNLEVLAMDGRLVMLAMLGGPQDELSLGKILRKRLSVMGSTLRNRALSYKQELTNDFASQTLKLFENGDLKPIIDRVYRLDEVEVARRRMEANKNAGKIVLRVKY